MVLICHHVDAHYLQRNKHTIQVLQMQTLILKLLNIFNFISSFNDSRRKKQQTNKQELKTNSVS